MEEACGRVYTGRQQSEGMFLTCSESSCSRGRRRRCSRGLRGASERRGEGENAVGEPWGTSSVAAHRLRQAVHEVCRAGRVSRFSPIL
jgi:hypothetical protein